MMETEDDFFPPMPDPKGHVCQWAVNLSDDLLMSIFQCLQAEMYKRAGINMHTVYDQSAENMNEFQNSLAVALAKRFGKNKVS